MLLTIKQISNLINYTEQGTLKLLLRLNIPLSRTGTKRKGNKWYFDTNTNHPFALSIRLQYQQQHLQVMYSVTQMTQYFNNYWKYKRDRKTIHKILTENDMVFHGADRKYVFLWDLIEFMKRLGKNY